MELAFVGCYRDNTKGGERERETRESEEAGSFPPALGLSSFLWDYMGEREEEGEPELVSTSGVWALIVLAALQLRTGGVERRSEEEDAWLASWLATQ